MLFAELLYKSNISLKTLLLYWLLVLLWCGRRQEAAGSPSHVEFLNMYLLSEMLRLVDNFSKSKLYIKNSKVSQFLFLH